MAERSSNQGSNNGNFFLDADDAKSLGNTEFMRKPMSIRRTFPKTVNGGELEFIQDVSSFEAKTRKLENGRSNLDSSSNGASTNSASMNGTGSTPSQSASKAVDDRRSLDSSLDLFRSMAKDIRR